MAHPYFLSVTSVLLNYYEIRVGLETAVFGTKGAYLKQEKTFRTLFLCE